MEIKIDEIVRSRRRTIALEVTLDGRLVVRAPMKTPKSVIEKAVKEKSEWIKKKLDAAKIKNSRHRPKSCAEGESFEFLGKEYILAFKDGADGVSISGGRLIVPRGSREDAERDIVAFYKARASEILRQRAEYYAKLGDIRFKSVKITGALTRWGSCSGDGRICFTWRLVMAPPEMIDYVVVHELAHIDRHNHSAAFWRRVGELMPDYAARHRWFKENAALLRRDFFAK